MRAFALCVLPDNDKLGQKDIEKLQKTQIDPDCWTVSFVYVGTLKDNQKSFENIWS